MGRMDNGHQTLIEFSENANIKLWEKEVTPPGIDGGGAIETTTMRNDEWRTNAPKTLKTLTESTLTCAYDNAVYPEIVAMVNVNQEIVITFPDGATLTFWGWLNTFIPNALVEGEQPTAEVQVIPSNQDANGDEIAPVHTPAA